MTEVMAIVPTEEQKQQLLEQKVTSVEEIAAALQRLPEVDTLTIKGIDDKAGYKAVDAMRKDMKATAVMVESKCKEEREEAVKTQKLWIAIEKKLSAPFREAEKKLTDMVKAIDAEKVRIEEEERKARELRVNGRVDRLLKCACTFDGINYSKGEMTISMTILTEMEDSLFDGFMEKVQAVYEQEQKEAGRVALEQRTTTRKQRCIDLGMEVEADAYVFKNTMGQAFILISEVELCSDENFGIQIAEATSEILSLRQKERDAQQAESQRLENERKAIENERLQVRKDRLEAIGMAWDGEWYCFKHIGIAQSALASMTNDEFTEYINEAKNAIQAIRAEEAEALRIKQERDQRINNRGAQLIPFGFVRAHDHYYHPVHNVSKVTFEVMNDLSDEEWKYLLDTCRETIADLNDKAAAEEKRRAEQAEAERQEAIRKEQERQEALKPDREKLQAFVDLVLTVKPPVCNTKEGAEVSYMAAASLEELATKIREQIKAM